jgi:hypothetical protein
MEWTRSQLGGADAYGKYGIAKTGLALLWQYCHMTATLCSESVKGVPFAGAIGNNPAAIDCSEKGILCA